MAVRDDADAEAFVAELIRGGYVIQAAVEQIETGRLATMRLLPPGAMRAASIVDLLFASAGLEPEFVARAGSLEILPGLIVCSDCAEGHGRCADASHEKRDKPRDGGPKSRDVAQRGRWNDACTDRVA